MGRAGPWTRRRTFALAATVLLLLAALWVTVGPLVGRDAVEEISLEEVLASTSTRTGGHDHVVVDGRSPILVAAATPLACWYDRPGGDLGLLPLLVTGDGEEEAQQTRLKALLGLGSPLRVDGADPTAASIAAATAVFTEAGGAVVVETGPDGYRCSLEASLLASYLDVPVLVREGTSSDGDIADALERMGCGYVVLAGPFEPSPRALAEGLGLPVLFLDGEELTLAVLTALGDRFGRVDYGVLTNPSDLAGLGCEELQSDGPVEWEERGRFDSVERTGHLGSRSTGESTQELRFEGAPGTQRLQVHARITSIDDPLGGLKDLAGVSPVVSLWLEDGSGDLVAYGSSIALRPGEARLDVVTNEVTGELSLSISVFYGVKGRTNMGTMGQGWDGVGWSRVSADWEVLFRRTPLATPLVPQLPGLSGLAPYLAAVHGGFVVPDPDLSYLDGDWVDSFSTATGPWYDADQHEHVNARVDRNVASLQGALDRLGRVDARGGDSLLSTYMSGPAWLAMLGDPVSLPHAYVDKDASWVEDVQYGLGWATDEPYRLEGALSIARPLSSSVAGVSTLIARTMFYEDLSIAHAAGLDYYESNDWGANYMLLYGEGGGQTGGLFWQRPFAEELRGLGFDPEQYGDDLENDRQTMVARGAYERSNYMEVMLHGNWYWYVPEMNGVDEYSTSVKVSDVRGWELGPSTFLSAACLMGRVDGVPPDQSIGLAIIHAGAAAFLGATRSTGSESGTRWMEWDLLYNDTSVGEAHRHSMQVNERSPTMYVRTLFADPAFNPFEPQNGFADQGRPDIDW